MMADRHDDESTPAVDAPVSKIPRPSDETLSRILVMLRPWSRPAVP
jgi:hypothetical protein